MATNAIDKLYRELESAAAENGCEILLIEAIGGTKAPLVRIYLDAPNGIGLDELADAQLWIDPIVDRIDPYPGAYTLEVSSPGIDRPLRTRAHFVRWAGEEVSLKLLDPIDIAGSKRRTVKGRLEGMEEDDVVVTVDGTETHIPFDHIAKAHVIGQIDFNDGHDGKEN